MSSQEPPNSPRSDGNKAFFGMHLTEEASLLHNIQHPPLGSYRFLCVSFWTQNVTRYLPDEDGWHCGPMPWCIGHPWWHVHLWKEWQGPQCKHHKLVQYGPKRRTHLQQQKMHHKTGVHNILWQSLLCRGILPRSMEKIQGISKMTPPQMKQELQLFLGAVNYLQTFVPHPQLKHWAPLGPPQKGELLCLGWEHQHMLSRK